MTRYHLVIGMAEFKGKMLPVINCTILSETEEYAEFIAKFMGHRIFELQKITEVPKFQNYQIN